MNIQYGRTFKLNPLEMRRAGIIQEDPILEESTVPSAADRSDMFGCQSQEKQEIKEDVRRSQKQVEQSDRKLFKLQSDGTELITNIQVATDFKESQRRAEQEEASLCRIQLQEDDAKISLEKFEEITEKWGSIGKKEAPRELWEALKTQQALCALLLENKNKLILELQQELKSSDDRYVKDLKKQGKDVDLLIERMEDQIRNLVKSFHEELDQIENAFEQERKEFLNGNHKNWEEMMKDHHVKELEYLDQRLRKVEDYEKDIHQLKTENAEKCNMMQINLDTKVQMLEQQIQQMKATCHLNQEKLEYNLHVLKKRDEGNTVTKSQQKRKITRLQDIKNNLRVRCAKQEKQSSEENQALTNEYKRIMEQYKHMQRKMRHFVTVDSKKFEEMWLMNEAEVKDLVEKALEIDRLVHEQQLGTAWVRPTPPFTKQPGPMAPQRQASKLATQAIAELLKVGSENHASDVSSGCELLALEHVEIEGSAESTKVSVQTLKKLLDLLCDETGFLIESKLLKLLASLDVDEQSLIKLDSIFLAMGIENEEDMHKLTDFFIKYKRNDLKEDFSGRAYSRLDGAPHTHRESNMLELIHPNDVLKTLRLFTSEHRRSRAMRQRYKTPTFQEDISEDAVYWETMANAIPASRLKIWNALEAALEKYYSVLKERSKLLMETQSLHQQNTELKMLLQQYINAKVRV